MNVLRFFQRFKATIRPTMAYTPRVGMQSAETSHRGCVRKKNEDSILSCPHLGLWAVADGMGGHLAGDYASQHIVSVLNELSFDALTTQGLQAVEHILRQAHDTIHHYSRDTLGGKTVGSTVCVLLLDDEKAHCLWMGDSRIYRYRQGHLEALTRDHSQAFELLERGVLSPSEVDTHPSSHVLTRAMGCGEFILDYSSHTLEKGDIFLLCSDGLYGALTRAEIESNIASKAVSESVTALLQQALEKGARDNVSLIRVDTATSTRVH